MGKSNKGPLLQKKNQPLNLQFGGTMTNFNSTIHSNRSEGKMNMNSAMSSKQFNTILPNDQHILEVTDNYESMISGKDMTLKKMSRVASQGKINTEKDFDVTTLFLPEIKRNSRLKIDKSQISQIIFDKPTFLGKSQSTTNIQDKVKVDELNTNILMNPGWGQMTKAVGLESQKPSKKPGRKNLFNISRGENMGVNLKKGSFISRLNLKSQNTSVRHLPQPPLGTSIGHGILKDGL